MSDRRSDPDLLEAVAAVVDDEAAKANEDQAEVEGMLGILLGYVPAGIGTVAVQRAMLATGISGAADLEERQEELSKAIRIFMDGFVIATRYAREHQNP